MTTVDRGHEAMHYAVSTAEFVLRHRMLHHDTVPSEEQDIVNLYNQFALEYDIHIPKPSTAIRHLQFFKSLLSMPLAILREAAALDGVIV